MRLSSGKEDVSGQKGSVADILWLEDGDKKVIKCLQGSFYDPPLFCRVSLMWGNSVCFTSSNLTHSSMNTKHEIMDVQN